MYRSLFPVVLYGQFLLFRNEDIGLKSFTESIQIIVRVD